MDAKEVGAIMASLFFLGLLIGGLVGWVMNIVALAQMAFDPITVMLVLRFVGIFVAPLGAILGYI